MFSNLGLLSSAWCPDPTCGRPRCFFSHAEASSSKSTLPTACQGKQTIRSGVISQQVAEKDIPTSIREPIKRKVGEEQDGVRNVIRKLVPPALNSPAVTRVAIGSNGKATTAGTGTQTAKLTQLSTPAVKSAPIPTLPAASTVASTPVNIGRPPVLPINLKPSPIPRPDRQKGLIALYTQYAKLYASILHSAPDLAHQSAFAQELETLANSSNPRTYKAAIHHAAVSIMRRPPPDSITHPSVGTVRESRLAFEAAEKERASKLSRKRVEKYCLPLDQFKTWRYPDPRDEALFGPEVGSEPDAEGTEQTCSRCKVAFVVSSKGLEERFGECKYHYGRTAPERVEGRRKWIYSCCGRERGDQGCEEGIHVFSDGEDDRVLAKRVGFKTVRQCVGEGGGHGAGNEVVAMDCEMIFTTAGVSLGRVTIVDEDGEVLLDELVRQNAAILDVNTRFSGISPGDLDKAVMDLPAVRTAACMFIGPETIIVGHGLENDLRALRLLHDKVIDTAVVFPHDKGPPFRRALRDIVKEKLGYFIQDRTSDLGHSSAVDAKSTLDALKWKVRDDNA
ncbi:RNA exonuclease 1 [Kwoniella heveanensis CBS 569]|uniref:RNA exonuclease 1 n=1 Tax=Kwoniella heveanensis BCC8398 TaxID=1296120 RepID=A0A1B9GLN1_9TREE|nr:RNA exonuclease 1 [Kwoniella heveanensis BCC8398]OCF43240.1 RNA exonuclease 1 [Kwoniella heveanensis CBS 569]